MLSVNRLSRKPDKSRGRAEPMAMRAAMRSRSAIFLSWWCMGRYSVCKAATACWRDWICARLRRG